MAAQQTVHGCMCVLRLTLVLRLAKLHTVRPDQTEQARPFGQKLYTLYGV